MIEKQTSLQPIGIKSVKGSFDRGETVAITDHRGKEIGRGITNYSSDDIKKILGKKTGEIKKILGYGGYDEVIHRDNLVVM
jgi:glutamate 5-kinase